MSAPFWYLFEDPSTVAESNASSVGRATSPASSSGAHLHTPSTTTNSRTVSNDGGHVLHKGFQNQSASSIPLHYAAGPPIPVEPTVLLAEIQQAAEDVSQLVGRFGSKMSATVQRHNIKKALFAQSSQLRLLSLSYADNFTCQRTKIYAKPVSLSGEGPLLWWLWDALVAFSTPSACSSGCTLDFIPTRNTDFTPFHKISIRLWSNQGVDNIELTATYGGEFSERRIFDAPIPAFRFPETGFSKTAAAALAIDQRAYRGEGSYKDTFDYLIPRPGSIWRRAIEVSPMEEKGLVEALAGTCKANDDHFYISEDQDTQCRNLVQRFPSLAREFVEKEGLVGREGGPHSRRANLPPGPKD